MVGKQELYRRAMPRPPAPPRDGPLLVPSPLHYQRRRDTFASEFDRLIGLGGKS